MAGAQNRARQSTRVGAVPIQQRAVDEHLCDALCLGVEPRAAGGQILHRRGPQGRIDLLFIEHDHICGSAALKTPTVRNAEKIRRF